MNLYQKTASDLIVENNHPLIPPTQIDEIDEMEKSIDINLNKDVTIPKDVLNSFNLKQTLNPEIWTKDQLNPKIKANLLKIAKDFMKAIELPTGAKVKDIIFTGSLANYNWSKFSDIDLHVVVDFNQFDADPKILDSLFYAQKTIWNQEHNIEVYGYPLEVYVQDANAELVATAVYSVLHDKWVRKPQYEAFSLDKSAVKAKANKFIYQLKDIRQDYKDKNYQSVVDKVTYLKDKIKQIRNAGLERGGEFSLENLVFKVLRRIPFMDQLDSFKAKAYDSLVSVAEHINEADVFNKNGVLLIKGAKLPDGTTRLYVTQITNLASMDKKRANDSKGAPAKMAQLGNQVFRVGLENGKLKAIGIAWSSDNSMLNKLGLDKKSVALNNSKTPSHWLTLKYDNIGQALNQAGAQIRNIPDIKWEA